MSTAQRKQAMAFIAAYDRPGADAEDRDIVRIARTWMSIMRSRHSVQGIVDRIMDEFNAIPPDSRGCGWQDLQQKFTAWAIREEWIVERGGG